MGFVVSQQTFRLDYPPRGSQAIIIYSNRYFYDNYGFRCQLSIWRLSPFIHPANFRSRTSGTTLLLSGLKSSEFKKQNCLNLEAALV